MPFALLPVSLVLAAACALLNVWLGFRVGQVRRRERIYVGDGGSEPLVRRMRAQANFVESAPFVLVLVAPIEFAVGPNAWLWALAAVFVAGRIAHPIGMGGSAPARMIGAGATMIVLLLLAGWAIAIPLVARSHAGRGDPAMTIVPAG